MVMQALDSSRIFGNWFLIKSKEGEDQNKIRLMFSNNGCSITDISYNIVMYPNSVTTLQLARFDGRIEFQGPFLKNLAPRSLPEMSAIFSRVLNLKWPPGLTKMSIKNDFEQLCHQ